MSISEKDIKLLWGRAAGICCFPECNEELTKYLLKSNDFVVGEMAHVIAKAKGGPRTDGKGGNDTYENLLLLCPTHHRTIDKAPEGTFPVEKLHEWKEKHEKKIRERSKGIQVDNWINLKKLVKNLLIENYSIWNAYGPKSQEARNNPTSNVVKIWQLKRMDTIVPNNQKIINLVEKNIQILTTEQKENFYLFKQHCVGFEQNAIERLEYYPRFPKQFGDMFNE